MSYIDELRERFLAAEQRFGQINQAGREYRDRLMGLMSRIEEEIRCRRDVEQQQTQEIERLTGEVDRISGENEQLRTMMMSLLTAVEAGDTDSLGSTLNEMDTKVATLIGEGQGAAVPGAVPPAEAAEDSADVAVDYADDISEESDEDETFSAPSFPAGDMMPLPGDEPPFSGEDADLDHDDGEMAAEEPVMAEEDDMPATADETPAVEAHAGAEAEAPETNESTDAGETGHDGSGQSGSDGDVASDMAEFFGADGRADDDSVPDYSHAVAGWEDFLDEDAAPASPVAEKEPLSEVSEDYVAEDAGDPEAGSIHDLIDRVKTVVDEDGDADQTLGHDAGDASGGEDDEDGGKAAAQ